MTQSNEAKKAIKKVQIAIDKLIDLQNQTLINDGSLKMDALTKAIINKAIRVRRIAFIILPNIKKNGEFIPCMVREGESGYYKTDWTWGKDLALAERLARERNERAGLTQIDVDEVVLSSL
jgi:hypothetical protein